LRRLSKSKKSDTQELPEEKMSIFQKKRMARKKKGKEEEGIGRALQGTGPGERQKAALGGRSEKRGRPFSVGGKARILSRILQGEKDGRRAAFLETRLKD